MQIIRILEDIYHQLFSTLNRLAGEWFLGLTARLVFASVLLMFFINSARTKVGSGFPDFLIPGSGAYAQILPPIAEASGYDVDQISFIPYGIIVLLGTYSEVIIPVMILIGLFTRAASLAMIGFIAVMTFVDIQFHDIGPEAIGSFFDRIHNSTVSDQRLLWVFPLVYLVLHGGGNISVDKLLERFRTG